MENILKPFTIIYLLFSMTIFYIQQIRVCKLQTRVFEYIHDLRELQTRVRWVYNLPSIVKSYGA